MRTPRTKSNPFSSRGASPRGDFSEAPPQASGGPELCPKVAESRPHTDEIESMAGEVEIQNAHRTEAVANAGEHLSTRLEKTAETALIAGQVVEAKISDMRGAVVAWKVAKAAYNEAVAAVEVYKAVSE